MRQVKSKKVKGKTSDIFELSDFLRSLCVLTFLLFTFAFLLPSVSTAQDDPPDVAPPPIKFISKEERARLDVKSGDLKDRTKLSLEMMNLRLTAAEKQTAANNFDAMFTELGVFQALMDDSLEFLKRRDNGAGKVLDNFKRLELGFRTFSPRIETIRRELPVKYDDYVRKLMKYVRDARTRATDPMFGETVVKTKNEK